MKTATNKHYSVISRILEGPCAGKVAHGHAVKPIALGTVLKRNLRYDSCVIACDELNSETVMIKGGDEAMRELYGIYPYALGRAWQEYWNGK